MVAILITLLITYFVTSLFGYVMHWALHQSWAGRFNTAHMTHHEVLYPASDYLSEEYRQAGKDSTPKFFAVAALPLVLAPIILWLVGVVPLSVMASAYLVELIVGYANHYLHDSFHIKNHWLLRVPVLSVIFEKWVRLHYLHHVDMGKNFGIFAFHWDRVFKTFWGSNVRNNTF